MKKIIITAIISAFTTVIVSSSSKKSNVSPISTDGTSIAMAIFRKDIGCAD